MSRVLRACKHGNCRFNCTQCRMNADLPRCPHGRIEERCPKCLSQCQHRRSKDGCPECNRCPHGQHVKRCKYCNHWTCQVDGCLYKGHRFCSKSSLKHHTRFICPQKRFPPEGCAIRREPVIPKRYVDPIPDGPFGSDYKYSAEDLAELREEREFWLAAHARDVEFFRQTGNVIKCSGSPTTNPSMPSASE